MSSISQFHVSVRAGLCQDNRSFYAIKKQPDFSRAALNNGYLYGYSIANTTNGIDVVFLLGLYAKPLSTSMLKQIASVDRITAERKYKDPFTFKPSHMAVLYTNFLPKIGSGDHGTWRRLVVAPFNAQITNPELDYAERLLHSSGGAVMRWIVEGAELFIKDGYKLPKCGVVETAAAQYRQENDWLSSFLEVRCVVGKAEKCPGGELYFQYRHWATTLGEYTMISNPCIPTAHRDFR